MTERISDSWLSRALPSGISGLARPGVVRLGRILLWGAFVLWLLFVGLVLGLRYWVLPSVGAYQPQIEAAASQAVGQQVRIGRIEARWRGLNPDLILDQVQLLDRQGVAVLSLQRVESVLSWRSLLYFKPMLSLLAFESPVLHVRREADGRITVAGLETEGESDPRLAEWVLEQGRIRVRNARVLWEDRQRQAPPLELTALQFALDNSGRRHRFGLSAVPPSALAARIDLRGEVRGTLHEVLDELSGKLYLELDYADLAGWRPWLDYPVDLPRGRGAVRIWGDLQEGQRGRVTADLALEELRIRLSSQLPELDLSSLRGRLEAQYSPGVWSLAAKKLELLTQDGIRVAPTDFQLDWRQAAQSEDNSGSAQLSFVDLSTLGKLADYLPLDGRTRRLLSDFQPAGQIAELRASWSMVGGTLKRYGLKANFSELGIRASGYVPGAHGLSGRVDLSEKGGDLNLDSAASGLSLPAVFPEPDIALDKLKAWVTWKNSAEAADIRIERLDFSGPEATGGARGLYRYTGQGPGEIDLTATVERADGSAVWRYMPHAVNANARHWLRRGIVSGRGYDGRLVLKGNLKDFPFRDPATGKFLVTAKASGARIDYADGWPIIDGVDADMSFGVGMKIQASRGSILGASLSNVTVEIPDFESHEEMLLVRGIAQGPTAEFLRFIEASPVAEKIDRFTDGMKAVGNGRLDLELDLPLRQIEQSKVRGDYHFQNNQLQAIDALPPLTQVNGHLHITEASVAGDNLNGRAFGGPFKVQVRNAGGKVGILAGGHATIAEVSKHFGWPLLDKLSGSTDWKADIAIRKRNVDLLVESNLLGISSPLPEPLNKNAMTAWPLRIERSAPDAQREQYKIGIGKIAQGLIVRRQGIWERGVFAVGEADPRLPERGLAIRVAAPQLDADAWRHYLPEGAGAGGGAAGGDAGLALSQFSIKTPSLKLMSREHAQVEVELRPRDNGWQIALNTREAQGNLFWREAWVEGNLKRLYIKPAAENAGTSNATGSSLIDSLPGMNLVVEDFRLGEHALGRLEVKARNDKASWLLDQVSLQNPDGELRAKGSWLSGTKPLTRLSFDLSSRNLGGLLDRLGQGDAVKRGSGKLAGELQWNGPLTDLHYPSLSGQLTVQAEKGQFNKLEPGVGKLLGLISLQSLPRRLTLDFRDIFSDGLAFDSIEGKLAVRRGIMRTSEPLKIHGPAAQVEIEGETDLKAETQNLQVVVRPELGGLAAVGAAAMAHPVVGAAALVANKVFQNPLNRLFSYRYRITGNWANPQVDKAGNSDAVPAGVAPTESGE